MVVCGNSINVKLIHGMKKGPLLSPRRFRRSPDRDNPERKPHHGQYTTVGASWQTEREADHGRVIMHNYQGKAFNADSSS